MQETIKLKDDKTLNVFGDLSTIDPAAMSQMYEAMAQDFVVSGAIMPDCHKGYTLPIGAVVATKDFIVPAYVGYDIGCGVCAVKLDLQKDEMKDLEALHKWIHDVVPVGTKTHKRTQTFNGGNRTKVADKAMKDRKGLLQLGTLGGGNHFLEIGYDEEDNIWIAVHSGSRGFGHGVATHYMTLASGGKEAKEGHYGFSTDSEDGKNYITDLNYALYYALENRRLMITNVVRAISQHLRKDIDILEFINRNHNHAELKDGLWIHRKGATHAEDGMQGVIPGNMRDGFFIVEGRGNPDSLYSSSHGAGRVMGRFKAKKTLDLEVFKEEMKGIVGTVSKHTLDESAGAYKDIFKVMQEQHELVKVTAYVKPLLSVKAGKRDESGC